MLRKPFQIINNGIPPSKGKVLIAEPFMQGDPFERSVILLVSHGAKDGSMGFILNKELKHKACELMPELGHFDAPVYLGGPVDSDYIFYLHSLGDEISNSVHVCDNIYWGGDFEELKAKINIGLVKANQVMFFNGYSGWSKEQLEEEHQEHAWLVTDLDSYYIMNHDSKKNLWQDALKKLGGIYKNWANFPKDPLLN